MIGRVIAAIKHAVGGVLKGRGGDPAEPAGRNPGSWGTDAKPGNRAGPWKSTARPDGDPAPEPTAADTTPDSASWPPVT